MVLGSIHHALKVLRIGLFLLHEVLSGIPFFLTTDWQNIHLNPHLNLNTEAPCLNFYHYSCTKWQAEIDTPDFEMSWNHFTSASYQIKKKIQNILERKNENEESDPLLRAQRFYNSCLHFEQYEEQYLMELRDVIRYFRGWPIVDENWSAEGYDWLEEVARISRKMGSHPVLKFHVGIDYKSTRNYVLYVEPGSLIFPQNVLLNPDKFSTELIAYENWIRLSIQHIFPKKLAKTKLNEIQKIIDFERKLAKLMSHKSKIERDTAEEFSARLYVNFTKIFNNVFPDLNQSSIIVINNYKYFKNVKALMQKISHQVIANYLIWTIVKEFSRDTSAQLAKLNFSMDKTVLGISTDVTRETECSNKAIDHFSLAILSKYLNLHINKKILKSVQDIAKNIKLEYVNLLTKNTWLGKVTLMLAIKKVKRIQTVVGYSEWMNNKTEVDKYYENLVISKDHFKNMVVVKQLKIERNFALLGKSVTRPLWPSNVFDVNAYYSVLQNIVFVPLGILQEPFYYEERPRIINYGALGSLIGHEFSHSLDTTGRQANVFGNIVKWWPDKDIFGYQWRTKCFDVNQSMDVLLIGENIADNLGLDLSYKAFKKVKNVELEDIFWNVQDERVFFLSFAQMWCEKTDNLYLFNDEHTSVETRVNRAVSNNHRFNQLYNCSKNLPICKLW